MLEFIENGELADCFRGFKKIMKEIADPEKTVKHFRWFNELNFFLFVMKRLCRMQKNFQVFSFIIIKNRTN